jgi:hypothetical protein
MLENTLKTNDMSDRFKFRVYNNKTNKWIHGPGYEVNLFGETILLGGFMNGVSLSELDDCDILQYTGLKDLTGKEIYEGDIIKGMFDHGPIGMLSTALPVGFDKERGYQWEYWDLSTLEVIGNIYNPPCQPDHNGECIHCDCWVSECDFRKK